VSNDPGAACLAAIKQSEGALRIAGPLDALVMQGRLNLHRSTLTPRGFGREIVLNQGGELRFVRDAQGRINIQIPADQAVEGQLDDGHFKLWGSALFDSTTPLQVDMHMSGSDLSYLAPKQYSLVFTPNLRFIGSQLNLADRRKMLLKGSLVVTEAAYFANHDTLGQVMRGVQTRQADTYSKPLLERMPWLGNVGFDIDARGQNLEFLSRFPLVKTDMEMRMNTKVNGTLASPELSGRIEIIPGSVVTYSLVKRDFEVTRGALDLDGDWRKAFLDVTAKTVIELDDDLGGNTNSATGIGPDLRDGSFASTNKVTVSVQAQGKLGAKNMKDFKLSFSSSPSYEQGDIQALIVTGQPLTGASGGALGQRSSINLLVDDVAEVLSKMLLSGFLDKVEVGVVVGGGVSAKVRKNIGKAIRLSGQYFSTAERAETRASFSFRISERLSMEGLLRADLTNSVASSTGNIYEGKLRYRVMER